MPSARILRTTSVDRSPRVLQIEGMFDVPPTEESRVEWQVDLPFEERDWNVGLIVGPSGSGKSTIAREIFGDAVRAGFDWPEKSSILDGFPKAMSVREISALLSSVGFSSPPSWLRPYGVLSMGERFRVDLARSLAEQPELNVIDEFTSVVDRTVARIGSAAIAKAVRRRNTRLVAVTCHYDVTDWLDPDWVYETAMGEFAWRRLRGRPTVPLDVRPALRSAWSLFCPHHYLAANLHPQARCFLAFFEEQPVAFAAVLPMPGRPPAWREHRTVCLPDFQGVGIGNALSELIAGVYATTGKPYRSVTGSPAMIHHRARSPFWRMTRPPGRAARHWHGSVVGRTLRRSGAASRNTASFLYVGPARHEEAKTLLVTKNSPSNRSKRSNRVRSARR